MGEGYAGEMGMSLVEFFAMSGYGEYVWSAYGFTLLALGINFYFAIRRLRQSRNSAHNNESEVD